VTNVVKLGGGLGVTPAELMEACFPADKARKELLHDLLAVVAREDEKTIRLLLGMPAEARKWAEGG
jgi:hypothetical protein